MSEKTPIVTLQDAEAARERIRGVLPTTPLAFSQYFSAAWDCKVWFKFENLHVTGSFKERGALNKLLLLSPGERSRGVLTASAGNHGQAVAWHARRLGIPATVVMPLNSPLVKVQNTSDSGARVILHGASFDDAVERARQIEADEGLLYIHGFDDPAIVAGQATLALELNEQCPELDMVVAPVGGGGLIAGITMAMKATRPQVRVVGVQFDGVPSMKVALEKGSPVTVPPHRTIADGIAVRHVGKLCFDIVQQYADEIATVSESEISNAILLMLERERTVVEGAGAVGVAAIQNRRINVRGRNVAVVLSGGNIDVNVLSRVIGIGLVKDGRLARLRVQVPDYPGQLSRILDIIAEARGNILDINHTRAFSAVPVGETLIELTLETRGEDHIRDIQSRLVEAGVAATRET